VKNKATQNLLFKFSPCLKIKHAQSSVEPISNPGIRFAPPRLQSVLRSRSRFPKPLNQSLFLLSTVGQRNEDCSRIYLRARACPWEVVETHRHWEIRCARRLQTDRSPLSSARSRWLPAVRVTHRFLTFSPHQQQRQHTRWEEDIPPRSREPYTSLVQTVRPIRRGVRRFR
jgi:hypothetical protein